MPRPYRFSADVDAAPVILFDTMAALDRWTEWDPELERIEWDRTPLRPGSTFTLKPKGGPRIPMTILAVERPGRLSDAAHLWGATMTTTHRYEPLPGARTRITVTIEIKGPLAFLWDRFLVRKIAAGTGDEMDRFVARATA